LPADASLIRALVAALILALSASVVFADPAAPADPAPADPSELDLFKLDANLNALVVTASGGVEEERSITSANVTSISRDEIDVHGWRSIAEVLGNVPGLYLIDDGVTPSLGVRGATGGLQAGTRIVKIMINGAQVSYRPDLTAWLGPEFIPMEAVERIEIAKGPLSALYGANAFLATVNIITKSASDGLHGSVEGRATVIRSYGGGGGSALVEYGTEKRGILATLSYDQIDRSGNRLQMTLPAQDPMLPIFNRESTGDLARPLSVFVHMHIGNAKVGQFTLQGGLQRLDSNGEFQLNSILTHQSRIALTNFWSSLGYKQTWNKVSLTASFGYSRGRPNRGDDKRLLTDNFRYIFQPKYGYDAVDGQAEVSYSPFGQRLTLRAGLDLEYSMERVLYNTQTFNQPEGIRQAGDTIDLIGDSEPRVQNFLDVGFYLQATSVPFKKLPGLHLTANFRVDRLSFGPIDYPTQFSWRAAIAYRWNANWVTKIIAGRAFQTPSGVLLFGHGGFGNSNNVIGNVILTGTAPLRPQSVTSAELLVSGKLFGHLALEGGFFYQDLSDKVEFIQTGPNFVAVNRGDHMNFGFEATLRFSLRWFSAYGNVSIQKGFSGSGLDVGAPPSYPDQFGLVGVDFDIKRIHLHANSQLRIVGPRGASQSNVLQNGSVVYELPTFVNWDITLSTMDLHLFNSGDTRVLLSARNLLDERHSEPGFGGFDTPNQGRVIYMAVTQTF